MSDRELLQQARTALVCAFWDAHTEDVTEHGELIDAIDARLSEPEWIPVGERLPVVPKGLMRVRVWCFNNQTGAVWKTAFHIPEKKMHTQATHWRYAEPTPQPPKDNP